MVTAWTAKYRVSRRERQICHSHLRRDFQAAIDRGGVAKPVGQRLLAASHRLFHEWHAFLRGEFHRAQLQVAMEPIQAEWEEAAGAAFESQDDKLHALGTDLLRQWDALWTFVSVEGVEPSNNDAERALRPAVLWRRGSFGTRSDAGSTFVARLLTVVHTAKRSNVKLVHWLRDTCERAAAGLTPAPLLSG